MTKQEKEDIRELLGDVIATHTAEINGKFLVIDEKLNSITAQTTKTNGKVLRLEEKVQTLEKMDLEHVINCPIAERVSTLENENLGAKSIRIFLWKVVAIAGTIGGIVFAYLEFIKK